MEQLGESEQLYCRTLWLSDTHLGNVHCKADYLLEMLARVHCRRLYLVGDIVDVWSMQRRVHWPQSHSAVLRELLKKSQQGVEIVYIPGNHDWNIREFAGSVFGGVTIQRECIHRTADGRRLLIVHGDELDFATRYRRLNRWVGDAAYALAMGCNRFYNRVRGWFGHPYWSLAGWLKDHIAEASRAIAAYEAAAVKLARDRGVDGIICGHLHHPAVKQYGDILYCNDGDWVENCTGLLEDMEGQLRLVQVRALQAAAAAPLRAAA